MVSAAAADAQRWVATKDDDGTNGPVNANGPHLAGPWRTGRPGSAADGWASNSDPEGRRRGEL